MQHRLPKTKLQIGSFIWMLLIASNIYVADPVLRLVSMQGSSVTEVEKQTSCQLEISIAGDHYGKPVFELPPQVKIIREGVSKSYSMTNGGMNQTTIYGYTLVFSSAGTITIGPALLNTPQGEKKSNEIKINVVPETKKKESDYAGFFTISSKKVYEGDIVPLKLQITIDPVNIQRIDVPHISHENIQQLKPWNLNYRDVKRVNDQQMLCQEWVCEIQCTKIGTFELPIRSLKALIGNGFFMSMFATQTSIAIKPLVIECLPLPLYQGKPVALLGNIRSLETKLSGSSVEIGKALTLDLIINYDTRCIVKEMPILEMPEGINCYFSQERNEPNKKILSFIIHPTKEGAYSIRAQKISFFNSVKEELGTVTTLPLSFKVKASTAKAMHHNALITKDESINALHKPFELSILGVVFFALLPLLTGALYVFKEYVMKRIRRRYLIHKLLHILRRTSHQVPAMMYEDIDQLIKEEKFESLSALLQEISYSSEAIHSANHWWHYLMKMRYAPEKHHNTELTMIIKQWIERYG
jgi:hypothetical protein